MIVVRNTLSGQLEELVPARPGHIGIYVCGATVQSPPHLGHGRFAVVFDVIRRYLMWRGFDVTYVQNVTDVEDKIIAAAEEAGRSVKDLAEEMAERFHAAFQALGVLEPDITPRATDHIPDMLAMIERLIERGLAYPANGDVYFSVRGFPGYGKLSGRKLDELVAGARVEVGELKRDPLDFALWKATKPGEPSWNSPWGPGRPGWHIECSAMSIRYLGFGFDIHAGGTDLIFPHHENEIAQSEAAEGTEPFVRYWLHNGMVNLGGEKMAKSTGLIVDLAEALARYDPIAVRLLYLRAHYRSPVEYSDDLATDAEASLDRLRAFRRRFRDAVDAEPDPSALERFRQSMDNDFSTPEAISELFDLVREGNRRADAGVDAAPIVAAFDEITSVLGITVRGSVEWGAGLISGLSELAEAEGVPASDEPAAVVEGLLMRRESARASRDFATADRIRDRLSELGIVVEDSTHGPRWHRR